MAELNVQQKNIVNQLRQAYPELKSYSNEQILSLYNQQLNNIQLSEASIMNGKNGVVNDGMGVQLETSPKAVSKEQEAQLKSALTARLNAVSTNVKKAEDSNGGIASLWSGIKNITGWGDSSNKVREQQKADLKALESGNIAEAFKQITGLDYTAENVNKFLNNEILTKSETALNGYTEGQKMALDVGADMISGILAVGALALAPVTGGASLLVAAGVGAATKVTIKALAPGEYSMKDLVYDSITGSINGALAPITNGLGGAVGTGIAKAFGLEALESTAKTALSQAVKHAGKEVVEEVAEETVKQGGKSLLTRILAKQGSEYVLKEGAEKTLKTTVGKVAAYTADMMVDGSLSGAGDGFARALAEGRFEDIPEEMLNGFVGGLIASPFIGGGFRLVGNASSTILNKINNKITFSSVLPDGTATKFGQGQVGDCPLLSMIDGFLANDRTKGLLTNAIQTDVNGNFAVKIGDKTVTVLRSSLTDEMLADQSGIRIFEQAYKQIAGDLDGGFADVVAKHFGLNPLHITSDNITDEVLEKIANDSDNYVLSLGARINSDGVVTPDGEFQHYFSIKNIDPKTKTVTLVDTYDTSKTLTMSFDDVKTQGISIDGGSVGKTDLPNSVRNTDDVKFRGEKENLEILKTEIQERTDIPDEHKEFIIKASDTVNEALEYILGAEDISEKVKIDCLVKYKKGTIKDLETEILNMRGIVVYDPYNITDTQRMEITRARIDAIMAKTENEELYTIAETKRKLYLGKLEIDEKKINKSLNLNKIKHCKELIMSDVMFIEALAIYCKIDVTNKTPDMLFKELKELFSNGKINDQLEKIQKEGLYWDTFFKRNSINDPINTMTNNVGNGDKVVHELNKGLANRLDTANDTDFRQDWINFCEKSDKAKSYMTIAETYIQKFEDELRNWLKLKQEIKFEVENIHHIIYRAFQRDCLVMYENVKTNFSDISSGKIQPITIIDKILDIIKNGNKYTINKNSTIDITEGIAITVAKSSDSKHHTLHTIEYNLDAWQDNAHYIPRF